MSPTDLAPGSRRRLHILALVAAAGLAMPLLPAAERAAPLSPEEALKRFQVEPGLRVELVAAEPLVVDPVAFTFDAAGRLFVAEGRGYPDPVQGGGTTKEGRIALLEDTNGDGRYDRRNDFATGLGYVNGIAPWRGGFFVTAAPDVLYLKDHDGDGVADERRVVLTGFEATKTAQLRVSHPTLGLDGKFYLTSGLNGGKVTSPLHPERAAVAFNSRDSRFDPDSHSFELTGGRAQFGLAFDPFGRRFITTNRHPVLQVMIEPWHLARNPHLAFNETTQEVSKVEAEAKVFPISKATLSADFIPKLMSAPHTGTFTSASGVLVFGGTGLTPEHVGNVFICESAQNLVQRQRFQAAGSSFRSVPANAGREFLASSDVWFRPVFLAHGPDGALYVADMYRREIDHPRYVPEESRHLLDFESGKDRGRIYRIVRDSPRPRAALVAGERATAELVHGLESPDEWWRADSFRLLIERADPAAATPLEKLAETAERPETRVRALWALRHGGRLAERTLVAAFRDRDARVREHAAHMAGEAQRMSRDVQASLLAAASDADARVRYGVALALGATHGSEVMRALASIAMRDGEDRWTRAAVLSSIGTQAEGFFSAFQQLQPREPKAFAAVMENLGRIFGAGASAEACRGFVTPLLSADGEIGWRLAALLGVAEGLRGRSAPTAGRNPLLSLFPVDTAQAMALQRFLEAAGQRGVDERAPVAERANAIALLGHASFDVAGPTLARLLDARHPPEVQAQAIRALDRIGDRRGGALLTAKATWSRFTPALREAAVLALTSKPALIDVLFDAIRSGAIAPQEISSVRRTQLLQHRDATVKRNAETVFKAIEGGDRMQMFRSYRELLGKNVDIARGQEAFRRTCSACHTFNGEGGKVGPDLTGLRNQPADAILLHILVPNYEVAPSYQTLSVTTRDGRSFSGWLAAESENSLTLRTAAGTEESVLRSSIASLVAGGVSLMPDGLEQTMAREEVGSLVAYLKSGAN